MCRSQIRGGRPSRQFGFLAEVSHGASNWTSILATIPRCFSAFAVFSFSNSESKSFLGNCVSEYLYVLIREGQRTEEAED
jgi:hypothetical protein